jgi:type II secretory pathway pseudopilin PulG
MRAPLASNQTGRRGRCTAFTLMELVVAIAAVAVVGVGLAALFRAVGKTVASGRRVSMLNTYAGLLESRMRRDFDAMTRDGFLVIRQQWVQQVPDGVVDDGPAGNEEIPVSADDTNPKWRRSDEIVFFVRGRFESARQPLVPGVGAYADAARVYYGHARRMRSSAPTYLQPELNDRNDDPLDMLGAPQAGNPNRYAGDWTLVRIETLLVQPGTTTQPTIPPPPAATAAQMLDSDRQIALQPAASSVFRWLNWRDPVPAPALIRTEAQARYPQFSSGLVDIATTDLDEIRRIILGATDLPANIAPGDPFPATNPASGVYNLSPWFPPTPYAEPLSCPPPNPIPVPPPIGTPVATRPVNPQSVDIMHAWMEQAFPAQSAASNPDGNEYYPAPGERPGGRVRSEPGPVNLLETMREPATNPLEQSARRADQAMLATNNFLPRCSNFIIEWSFGATDAAGQIVWHGPKRWYDLDANGRPGGIGEVEMVLPYPYDATGTPRPLLVSYPLNQAGPNPPQCYHTISDRLIYGYTPLPETSVLTSYFGYVDPTFAPPDRNGNGTVDANEPMPPTLPWPWPRLIRVTITLSDPQEPTVENTFQFIFRTPEEPGAL